MNDALEKLIIQVFLFLPKLRASLLIFLSFWLTAEVEGYEGKVIDLDLRYTTIQANFLIMLF
ncbi:MAG: hypothetical protein SAJ37_08190 [Oscillatoria sp. PMC 1068.18]|nr:hypothetical protein [Oscillatoria sp. PMC 1068.18]